MCGIDGSAEPWWMTVTPSVKEAAQSSSPETNWDDALASIRTLPPRSAPEPRTVNGSRSPSISAPNARNASSTVDIGLRRAASSPSMTTGPVAVAANAGTNRITVPARPQSISAGPVSGPGVTAQSVPESVIEVPRARRAPAIRSVSRLRSGALISDGPVACAARMRARFVSDLEPGTATRPRTGRSATGACHEVGSAAERTEVIGQ